MLSLTRRPWLHFLVLGAGLHGLFQWLHPPPLPSVGPLAPSQVESVRQEWLGATGALPTDEQLRGMVQAELDREILFREGLALRIHIHDPVVRQRLVRNMRFLRLGEGKPEEDIYQSALRMELHLGDEVIRRRLIQVVEQWLLGRHPPPQVTEEDIAASFAARREELRRPVRYSIEHIYLTRERGGEAPALLAQIRKRGMDAEQAREFSSPFLPGYRFRVQSPGQLARNFGVDFAARLQSLAPAAGEWVGPVESTYGQHLVWVDAIEPERDARLEEVREQLLRDLQLERRRLALREAVARLRKNYEVLM